MISTSNEKWVDAVYREKWVCATIFHHNFDHMLIHLVYPFAKDILKQKVASKFIFERIGENLLLIFKTSQANNDLYLKPRLFDFFSKYFEKEILPQNETSLSVNTSEVQLFNKYIDYDDYFILKMTYVVGLKTATVITEILSESSRIILAFIEETNEKNWNVESAIEKAIPIHLGFAQAFGMNLNEIAVFYDFYFNKSLNMIQNLEGVEDLEDWKAQFVLGIDNNYKLQKDAFVNYCEYLLKGFEEEECFEEDWINEWLNSCTVASKTLLNLQKTNEYLSFGKVIVDDSLNIDFKVQEKWPIFETILKTVNNQLGINFSMEFNLIYFIKESIVSLMEKEKE